MAAQSCNPEVDPKDPPGGQQLSLQATTVTGREGAPWEALYTAIYRAQGSPNGPDTPEPTEAWVQQAKAMRNYHIHHPFDDSPTALPWPTDPPQTVQKLADLTRNRVKATMQTPGEPPLQALSKPATYPFFQPQVPPAPPPPVPPKRARRKRGAPAPSPQQARIDGSAATSEPRAPPWTLPDQPGVRPAESPPPCPDQASSLSSLPSHAPPQPQTYSQY